MITLQAVGAKTREIPLGQQCEFALMGHRGPVESQFFLEHNDIHYVKPLTPLSPDGVLRFFPESPGQYTLYAWWRTPDGTRGRAETSFEVVAGPHFNVFPQLIQVDSETKVWVTSQWEANLIQGYEQAVITLLPQLVKPNAVIYDIGANIGLYAIRFARLAEKTGHVYCVEANPVCVYFLRANMHLNLLENYDIFPVAVSQGFGKTRFTINYGNLGLGLGESSPFFVVKPGHEIEVEAISLDDLIDSHDLREPDLIKMDIEGGEASAVKGMRKTIERSRPTLIFELHGRDAARGTLEELESGGYRYQELPGGRTFSNARELIDWFPNAVLQIIGRPA